MPLIELLQQQNDDVQKMLHDVTPPPCGTGVHPLTSIECCSNTVRPLVKASESQAVLHEHPGAAMEDKARQLLNQIR